MRRARYLGVSRASIGGERRLTYGELGFVDDSDPRGLKFVQATGECWVVDRHEVEDLSPGGANLWRFVFGCIDGIRHLDWASRVVLVLLGAAICFGVGFAAAMIGGWLS